MTINFFFQKQNKLKIPIIETLLPIQHLKKFLITNPENQKIYNLKPPPFNYKNL